MLVASILNMDKVRGLALDIVITGCVDEFKNLKNVKLIDACSDAESGMLSKLRFIAGREVDADIIVFIDDDFIFPEEWLVKLANFSLNNDWDILGNRILLPNGDRFWDRCTFRPHRMIDYDSKNNQNVYQTGGFWVITNHAYSALEWNPSIPINATNEGFPFNEDVDMSLRANRLGFKISFDKDNLVWHNDKSYQQSGDIILKIPEYLINTYSDKKEFSNLINSLQLKLKNIYD